MRWDDSIFTGQNGQWHWIVSRKEIDDLANLVVKTHAGCRLWISAFDSGPISPSPEESAVGWKTVDGAMVSPPLVQGICVPCDNHDEWYVFEDDLPKAESFERFVNYGCFNLADPREMAASFDPTWERSGLDWLYPIQERFWSHLERLLPLSYVSSGDYDIVVTRRGGFAASIRSALGLTSCDSPTDDP